MFVYKLLNYEPGLVFAWPLAIITEHLEAEPEEGYWGAGSQDT